MENILVNIACQFWRNIPLWLFPRKGKVLWVAFIEAGVAHCCASVVRPPPLGEQLDIGLGFVFKQLNTFDKKKHWKQYLPPLRGGTYSFARLISFNVIWTNLRSLDKKGVLPKLSSGCSNLLRKTESTVEQLPMRITDLSVQHFLELFLFKTCSNRKEFNIFESCLKLEL